MLIDKVLPREGIRAVAAGFDSGSEWLEVFEKNKYYSNKKRRY
jgi:hypothetical protein